MTPEQLECAWLDERERVSLGELSQVCGFSAAQLVELVEYGALAPIEPGPRQQVFSAAWVAPLRAAARLHLDLELDLFAVALLLDHLQRIDALERQIRSLQAQLPARAGRA